MYRPVAKYANSQKGVYWHANPDSNLPVRTDKPRLLRKHELDQMVPCLDYHARIFDMANHADKTEFIQILDKVANRLAAVRKRIDKWADTDPAPKIWLEWVEAFLELPADFNYGESFNA